jgi:hypothetical protein
VNVNVSHNFSFNSERFLHIHQRTLLQFFDFAVCINHEPFLCNSAFASCLSQTIFELKCQNSTIQEIHFYDIAFDDVLFSLFEVLNGHSFLLSSTDLNSIQLAIDLIDESFHFQGNWIHNNFSRNNSFSKTTCIYKFCIAI